MTIERPSEAPPAPISVPIPCDEEVIGILDAASLRLAARTAKVKLDLRQPVTLPPQPQETTSDSSDPS